MEKLGKLLTSTWSSAVLAVALVFVYTANLKPIETLQLKTFDYIISSLQSKSSDEIVIVEFDEKTVEKFGQWPFDRRDIASTITKLRENGAGPIVMPILFSEKDRAGGDKNLSDTIKDNGIIISQTPTTQDRKPDAVRRGFSSVGNDPLPWTYTWRGAISPLSDFAGNSEGVGLLASIPESDGVVRRLPMLARIGNTLYPSLVLETLRVVAGDPSYQIKTSEAGIEFVRIPAFPPIATDQNGRIWLSWNTSFKKISATEIDESVKNKIIVLGITIEGVGGIVATPIGEKWAHEIQAQALQTIIDGTSITRLSYAKVVEIISILLLSFF